MPISYDDGHHNCSISHLIWSEYAPTWFGAEIVSVSGLLIPAPCCAESVVLSKVPGVSCELVNALGTMWYLEYVLQTRNDVKK